jgi:3-hydroxyacyl-[acyl-carrier protein] dehydratase/trans-2-decenoyl-[acyl-carrier protein] isomerase
LAFSLAGSARQARVGRLGLGELKFSGQVLPTVKKVIYGIDIKACHALKARAGHRRCWLSADGNVIYRASDLKVGLFKQDQALQPGSA